MNNDELDLGSLRSLRDALGRMPNGAAAIDLADRMGIWSRVTHAQVESRPPFHSSLASLEPPQLSNALGLWTSEYGRIAEVCGAINGQEAALKIELRSAQAKARSRIRKRLAEAQEKMPAAAALNDEADEDPAVSDLFERAKLLAILSAAGTAAKEATAQYLASLSREIAFRDAQMKARMY